MTWTLAQHGAFFASAWLVSWWAGAESFGAWSQALALATMLSTVVTLRLEYAGQLEPRQQRADSLFAAAWLLAVGFGVAVGGLALAACLALGAPWWLCAGALAVVPLAALQIRAASLARAGLVARAAATRAAPALWMLALQVGAATAARSEAVIWTLPMAAGISWCLSRPWHGRAAGAHGKRRLRRLLRARWAFVRAEWPGLLLNTSANHGQVLLVGWLAGNGAAGVMALGLRVAMLPTSLVGLAWADSLRSRVIAHSSRAAARALVVDALRRMAVWSAGMHLVGAWATWWVLPLLFPQQGSVLVAVVLLLLPLGAVRMVASPMAFLLAWRGWLGLSLLGQCLLFGAALGAAVIGGWYAGVSGVAAIYAVAAACVYVGYIWWGLRAVRADT